MESEGFRSGSANRTISGFTASNITEFHFFDLEFADPTNVVLLQIIFPGQVQLLDLAPLGGGPSKLISTFRSRLRGSKEFQMVNKIRIKTDAGPPALGTYSQAIRTGDLVFVTAQTGRDPDTGKLEEGLAAQTRRMLRTSTRSSTPPAARLPISSR